MDACLKRACFSEIRYREMGQKCFLACVQAYGSFRNNLSLTLLGDGLIDIHN